MAAACSSCADGCVTQAGRRKREIQWRAEDQQGGSADNRLDIPADKPTRPDIKPASARRRIAEDNSAILTRDVLKVAVDVRGRRLQLR